MLNIGKDVVIEPGVIMDVEKGYIGDRTIIRSGARIEGSYVQLGIENYLDHGAWIGGGSCHDREAYLIAGDWLHMGWNSQINIARGVDIGDEVGIGIETKVFTHGAYLPTDCGFPIQWDGVRIGNRVWLPHAWVNPGVTIGDDVVVAAMSLVNSNLDSGCLYGGIPAKKLKANIYPKDTKEFYAILRDQVPYEITKKDGSYFIRVDDTIFDLSKRIICGKVTKETELVKNQLRRNGIRFRYYDFFGIYIHWGGHKV